MKSQKTSSTATDKFSLDNLKEDDLLTDILLRLPTAKFAIRSKLVSKRWCSLISSPYFVSQFISRRIIDEKKKKNNNTDSIDCYAGVYQSPPSVFITKTGDKRLVFVATEEEFPKGFSLEFLPESRKSVSILASSNDLLFCRARTRDYYVTYDYICNPFTMQWLRLPPAPIRNGCAPNRCSFAGLVCEANYCQQQYHESRFRVLRFTPITKHDSSMDIYCSETKEWKKSPLFGSQYNYVSNAVSHDWKLYWYNGTDVVAYDPFNDGKTIFIDGSEIKLIPSGFPTDSSWCCSLYLGVCQGFLRFMQLINLTSGPFTGVLSVWELKDNETRKLSLVSEICCSTMIPKMPWVQELLDFGGSLPARLIAFHPNDKDVVYLGLCQYILSWNIQTRELEFISKPPYEVCYYASEEVFPIAFPWWPTPVSTLPQNAHL